MIQSWRVAFAVAAGRPRLEVCASSTTIAFSGRVAPTAAARVVTSSVPVGAAGGAGSDAAGEGLRGGGDVLGPVGQGVHGRAVGDQVGRLAWVGEEGYRRAGPGQHDVPDALQLLLRGLDQVSDPLQRRDAGAARLPGREHLPQHPRTGRGADAAGRAQPGLMSAGAAEQQQGRLRRGQHRGRLVDRLVVDRLGRRQHAGPRRNRTLAP